jgi:hypothetical protein
MAWTTDQESLHRHVEDDEALLRLYTTEARRQARGDWRVYQRLHACHCCMVDYNTQALANDKVHDPATLRALFQGVGMTGRCAIMWAGREQGSWVALLVRVTQAGIARALPSRMD